MTLEEQVCSSDAGGAGPRAYLVLLLGLKVGQAEAYIAEGLIKFYYLWGVYMGPAVSNDWPQVAGSGVAEGSRSTVAESVRMGEPLP